MEVLIPDSHTAGRVNTCTVWYYIHTYRSAFSEQLASGSAYSSLCQVHVMDVSRSRPRIYVLPGYFSPPSLESRVSYLPV